MEKLLVSAKSLDRMNFPKVGVVVVVVGAEASAAVGAGVVMEITAAT